MIAANIGKVFLKAYNEKYQCNYSPREFFEQVYCELFYNHNKYMMTAGNSPLENPKISWEKMRKGFIPYETPERRLERIHKTIAKIENEPADASIGIGYPSLDVLATTSGQITNLDLPLNKDDAYLSWIGAGLGIGVQGGLSILFTNPTILLDVYEGWDIYRRYLNEYPNLRGNQITTWNGQWICHRYDSYNYDEDDQTASFEPLDKMKDGDMEVKTQSWSWLMFRLANQFPDHSQTVYIYNLGQTNTTMGFIQLELPRIYTLDKLYEKYFGTTNKGIAMQLFGTAMGLSKACQTGGIGVNAMEPKGFRDCITKGAIPKYNLKNEEQQISFNTYKIWLIAMLNDETLWGKAEHIAQLLHDYSVSDKNAKKTKSNEVEGLLKSVNRKQFIDSLTSIVKESKQPSDLYEIGRLIDRMPVDNVPYFLTLIRFNYEVKCKTN